MTDAASPQNAPLSTGGVPQPSRNEVVKDLLGQKVVSLSAVTYADNADDRTAAAASDEMTLCNGWIAALNADDPIALPTPDQDQPLRDAIMAVDGMVNTSATANALFVATSTLISAFKPKAG